MPLHQFPLHQFQKDVYERLSDGRSVILQAPTGAGKTRAALYPFFRAWEEGSDFPRKCIYSVPMRVLANQFNQEYTELAESHSRRLRPKEVLTVKIQTGEHPDDPRLLGNLIFATIDQSLSSALAVPYSLSAKMANLNAGAFYSSYLIFDEFHLFPIDERSGAQGALVTTLQLLAKLKGIVPFILMTATFSSTMLDELSQRLGAEVVTVGKEEYLQIASGGGQEARRRYYHIHQNVLTADAVLTAHAEDQVTRSIVICNQVARAQKLYQELREHPERGNVEIRLLHSRFTQEDRQAKEEDIRREFGKKIEERQIDTLILVATQVVEVGLDITCDRLHTEIAPANAIFQRAGRCARYPGEIGHVHIYQVPPRRNDEHKPDYLPYPLALCTASWQSFCERDGQEFDFEDEQTVIDEVHTDMDQKLLAAMDDQRSIIWKNIFGAMEEGDRSCRRDLIRRIDSITILAADPPERVGNPFTAQGFSLFRGSVYGIWQDLESLADEHDPGEFEDRLWTMQYPMATGLDSEDATEEERYTWHRIDHPDLINSTSLIAVNSAFCAYDEDLGFRILSPCEETGWTSEPGKVFRGNRFSDYSYRLESYAKHIKTMVSIYEQKFQEEYTYVQRRLAEEWDLPLDKLDKAIRLAIACHDLGKLDKRWQHWVRLYQKEIGAPISDANCMAVHTSYDPKNSSHQEAQKQADRWGTRPPHAAESAVSAAKIIAKQIGDSEDLARAVLTAIARHHNPCTANHKQYELHISAENALARAMEAAQLSSAVLPLTMQGRGGPLDKILIKPEQFKSLLLYLYVVRMLRLCDGMSQEQK